MCIKITDTLENIWKMMRKSCGGLANHHKICLVAQLRAHEYTIQLQTGLGSVDQKFY